jgi:predicted transcriptional regulator YdeE
MALAHKTSASIIVALAVILSTANGEIALTPQIIEKQDAFTVIGISVRTNNKNEATPDGLIGKQWQRLFQENLLNKIPSKADANIIAIYTDYASGKDGDYTFILGAKVNSDKEVPAGMVAVKVLSGRYAMFTSEKGVVYKVVPELWRRIWAVPKSAASGDRAYKTDFELYDQRAVDPQNSQVDVYIGIN